MRRWDVYFNEVWLGCVTAEDEQTALQQAKLSHSTLIDLAVRPCQV